MMLMTSPLPAGLCAPLSCEAVSASRRLLLPPTSSPSDFSHPFSLSSSERLTTRVGPPPPGVLTLRPRGLHLARPLAAVSLARSLAVVSLVAVVYLVETNADLRTRHHGVVRVDWSEYILQAQEK